jgi:hypothetical protein
MSDVLGLLWTGTVYVRFPRSNASTIKNRGKFSNEQSSIYVGIAYECETARFFSIRLPSTSLPLTIGTSWFIMVLKLLQNVSLWHLSLCSLLFLTFTAPTLSQSCSALNQCSTGCCSKFGFCGLGPECKFCSRNEDRHALTLLHRLRQERKF